MPTPRQFIESLDPAKRADVAKLHALIRKIAPTFEPAVSGTTIGYGKYDYEYASGRKGSAYRIALASNKNGISVHVLATDEHGWIAEQAKDRLGKASVGKSCIRFHRLADVELAALASVLGRAVELAPPSSIGRRRQTQDGKSFRGTVFRDGSMCFIAIPFDPKTVFGKVRAPVKVTLNGYTYRSTIASMGNGPCVPLRRSHREAAGLEGGETLRVTVALDREKREVAVPADLATALRAAGAWERWSALAFTHRREHVEAVEEAKKPETRARRIAAAVAMITKSARR